MLWLHNGMDKFLTMLVDKPPSWCRNFGHRFSQRFKVQPSSFFQVRLTPTSSAVNLRLGRGDSLMRWPPLRTCFTQIAARAAPKSNLFLPAEGTKSCLGREKLLRGHEKPRVRKHGKQESRTYRGPRSHVLLEGAHVAGGLKEKQRETNPSEAPETWRPAAIRIDTPPPVLWK